MTKNSVLKTASLLLCISFITQISPVYLPARAQDMDDSTNNLYENNEVIVKYKATRINLEKKNWVTQLRLNSIEDDLNKKEEFRELNTAVYESDTKTTMQLISEFKQNPNVEYVEPNYKAYIFESSSLDSEEPTDPNDTYFDMQWALDNDGQLSGLIDGDIQAKEAWELSRATGTGASMMIGVIDTGIDYTHPDLQETIWLNPLELAEIDDNTDGIITYKEVVENLTDCNMDNTVNLADLFCSPLENGIDEDNNGYIDDFLGWDTYNNDNDPYDDHSGSHGTHVAGIIGAQKDNFIGIAGINPDAKLVAIKAFDTNGSGNFATISNAIGYSDSLQIKITNNSFGTTSNANYREAQDNPAFGYSMLRDAMKTSGINNNTLFIVASGNGKYLGDNHPDNSSNGFDIDTDPSYTTYPAAYDLDNIITVASSNRNDDLSSFSNYGEISVDIAAPGAEIYSTIANKQYGYKSGTSMATPMVTGAASLLFNYLTYLNAVEPNDAELKTQILEHSKHNSSFQDMIVTNSRNETVGLNLYNIHPPVVVYEFGKDSNDIINLNIFSNKPGTLDQPIPSPKSKTHSIPDTGTGSYLLEFEDEAHNLFSTTATLQQSDFDYLDNLQIITHPSQINRNNQNSLSFSGSCYLNNPVNLIVYADTIINSQINNITCTSGTWTQAINLSALKKGVYVFGIQNTSKPVLSGNRVNITKITPDDPIITSPSNDITTTSNTITVKGTGEPFADITITGGISNKYTTVSSEGSFQTDIALNLYQTNTLVVNSIDQYAVRSENTDSVNITQTKRSSEGSGGGGGGSKTTSPIEDLVVTVTAFEDIEGNKFEEYINQLLAAKIVSGYSDGTYRPDETVTREQMAKFIVNAFAFNPGDDSNPGFSDITSDSKFKTYIATLKQLKIINGYSNGTYRPSSPVSRGEVTKFVALALINSNVNISGQLTNIFPDLSNNNPFAYYINYLAQNNINNEPILSGYSDGTFKADESLTRGQMAKIIWNSMQFAKTKQTTKY